KYQTSRLMADRALIGIKEDNMNVMDAAAAIYHVAESAEYIAREAVQIHGGIGYVREGEVERLLRDAILGQIGAGTTEIRKKLIAQGLVKKYKKQGRISD
ncbi:MAG TPA: acyl-CoA dehydrogenase family protein, partial [Thermoplasmataceae archaeon]|nr:acyl-CoA dehydrogenase family protein [Thermoplasmataceae archaeon]